MLNKLRTKSASWICSFSWAPRRVWMQFTLCTYPSLAAFQRQAISVGETQQSFPFCTTRITQRKGSEEYVILLKLQSKFRKKEKHLSWNIATSQRLTPYFSEKCHSHNDKKVVKSSCFIQRKVFQFNFHFKNPKFRAMLFFLGTLKFRLKSATNRMPFLVRKSLKMWYVSESSE